ncbi:hypothetical protein [Tenacibaculum piscium]|uniref:hypothetical protein n=1 Tax=Tenacibaculum piscium TaxID=1458515 RepID=UPI001F33090C|nr:hypothetical protein [Tenacibaculum piscium]
MNRVEKQRLGTLKNKLLRYKDVLDYYHKVKSEYKYITIVELHRDFIYPKFYISRCTLYTILGTPVVKELKELQLKETEKENPNLFNS